jgi:glycosyltransferase involved in cell wall biosynthesis/GT2 family glycosyltransferase
VSSVFAEPAGSSTLTVRVVAVAAAHDRRDLTVRWVRSLLDADRTGLALHVIVVDDGSTDGTAEAVRDVLPTAEVVTADGSLYYARGTNLGLRHALVHRPDYVLVANDDTELAPDCLQHLVDCAMRRPRSAVAPVLVHADDPGRAFQTFPRWQTRYGGWRHRHHLRADTLPDEPLEAEVLVGNCILVPTRALDECGLLDDRGIHNWVGDAEWTPRLRRAGWRLLVDPRARVVCAPNADVPSPWTGGLPGVRRALTDPLSPYCLQALWANRTISGPDPARGAAAFAIHVARMARHRLPSGTWPDWPDEAVPGPGARTPAPMSTGGFDLVLIWPYLTWGGAQTHLIGASTHLDPSIRVRALVPDGSDPHLLATLEDHHITPVPYGPPIDLDPAAGALEKVRRRLRDARSHRAIWLAVRDLDPRTTVLHVDLAPWSTALLTRALARRFVTVQTLHTAPPPLPPLRRLVWRAKLEAVRVLPQYRLTVGNRDAGRGFDDLLGHALGAALTPTAVDGQLVAEAVATVDPTIERTRLRVPDGSALVVGAGQVVSRKGIDVLLAAVARVSGPPVAVRWFGAGPLSEVLADRARSLGVDLALIPPDAAPTRVDLFRAFAAADVYVQPSREEGLPLALVEAMATGTPAVASAVNAIPEVVVDGETGLLVPPDDPGALAEALERLLADAELATRLGRAGADLVARHHSLLAVAGTFEVLYRRGLEDAGATR